LRNLEKENKYSLSLPSPLLKYSPLKPFTLFLGGVGGGGNGRISEEMNEGKIREIFNNTFVKNDK
jgi:hypothetical protein